MTEDRLRPLRDELEQVHERPLEDRPELFERAHQALVQELNALEEV